MKRLNSVKIVEDFWAAVWKAGNPDAIDRFVVDDFIITTGSVDIVSKSKFKEWVKQFLEKVADFNFEVIETFPERERKPRCLALAGHGQKQWNPRYACGSTADRLHRHGDLGGARRREIAPQLG